jgi:hypothetical protein
MMHMADGLSIPFFEVGSRLFSVERARRRSDLA